MRNQNLQYPKASFFTYYPCPSQIYIGIGRKWVQNGSDKIYREILNDFPENLFEFTTTVALQKSQKPKI